MNELQVPRVGGAWTGGDWRLYQSAPFRSCGLAQNGAAWFLAQLHN